MTPVIRRLVLEDHALLRDLRLRALTDAPEAFGSTYEREAAFAEADWRGRLAPTGVPTFAAEHGGDAVGIVSVGIGWDGREVAQLLSMWVAPPARGTGVVDALIAEALACAGEQRCSVVRLDVIDGNQRAERTYRRHGFARTGRSSVRERDGALEVEMERPL